MNESLKPIQEAIDSLIQAAGNNLTPRQIKAIEISKVISSYAQLLANNCVKITGRKRVFPKIDRRPIKRLIKNRIKLQMMLAYRQTQIQIASIIAQPVRKFQSGVSEINTSEKEIIFTASHQTILTDGKNKDNQ